MKTLIITLGITGSGKSTWLNDKSPVIETDDIRKELLGDVSDISKEKLIFDTAKNRIISALNSNDTVYFGATNVYSKHRVSFLKSIVESIDPHVNVDVMIFKSDPNISNSRISKDLKSGKGRANSIELIDEQYEQYKQTLRNIRKEEFPYRFIKYVT